VSKLPGDGGSSRLSFVVFAPSCWFNECALDYTHACIRASRIRSDTHMHARTHTNARALSHTHVYTFICKLAYIIWAQVSGALPDFEFDIDFDVPPASGGA
jgi:hypothetical protein